MLLRQIPRAEELIHDRQHRSVVLIDVLVPGMVPVVERRSRNKHDVDRMSVSIDQPIYLLGLLVNGMKPPEKWNLMTPAMPPIEAEFAYHQSQDTRTHVGRSSTHNCNSPGTTRRMAHAIAAIGTVITANTVEAN